MAGTPPFTKGTTWCLDVVGGAERSQPGRPGEEPLDAARHGVRGQALLLPDRQPDRDRRQRQHSLAQVVHDFRQDANGDQTGTVEEIEFTDPNPRWKIVGNILQPLATTKAVLLPDGKVLIGQGVNRSRDATSTDGRARSRKGRSSLPDVRPCDRLGHETGQERRCREVCTGRRRCCRMRRCSSRARTARLWFGPTIHRFR